MSWLIIISRVCIDDIADDPTLPPDQKAARLSAIERNIMRGRRADRASGCGDGGEPPSAFQKARLFL